MKNFQKTILFASVLASIFLPFFSFAQSPQCSGLDGAGLIICKFGSILASIIPVLIALGVVYFIFGVVQYVINDDEEAKTKGKDRMIWGIIGLTVIFAMWGLVSLVITTFGLDQGDSALVQNFIQNNAQAVSGSASSCQNVIVLNKSLGSYIDYATCLIGRSVIPLIIGIAVATFLWGVVQYVINTDDEAKREKGKQFVVWGLIGLSVMISVWGLVRIVGVSLGIEYAIPQLKK